MTKPAIRPTRNAWQLVVPLTGLALLALLNTMLLTLTDWTMLRGGDGADWSIFVEAGRRVTAGNLYAVEDNYAFRYSPLLAWTLALIAPIGPLAWRLLHIAAAGSLAFRSPWLALAVFVSWPFWFDVEAGNLMTFVVALAVWALAGRGWAIGGFMLVALLAPRPLMLPVLIWLLWNRPAWRVRFAGLFVVHAAVVLATGLGPAWIGALVGSGAELGSALNFGPSRLIGANWVPIGLVLGLFLTIRGRLGLASLAASPYWLPYYLLMAALDLPWVQRAAAPSKVHPDTSS